MILNKLCGHPGSVARFLLSPMARGCRVSTMTIFDSRRMYIGVVRDRASLESWRGDAAGSIVEEIYRAMEISMLQASACLVRGYLAASSFGRMAESVAKATVEVITSLVGPFYNQIDGVTEGAIVNHPVAAGREVAATFTGAGLYWRAKALCGEIASNYATSAGASSIMA